MAVIRGRDGFKVGAKCRLFALQKLTLRHLCVFVPGHVVVAWKLRQKQCTFGNQILRSHSEETKKGNVFEILNQLRKLSKSNDVHA